jgi:hypothetical protein
MPLDLDTFLTALYCITNNLYQEHGASHKPSHPDKVP